MASYQQANAIYVFLHVRLARQPQQLLALAVFLIIFYYKVAVC
jgi:hypothetical protein